MLIRERPMRRGRIGAHTHDRALERMELLAQVAKFLALERASGSVVLRIEIDRHRLPMVIAQPARAAELIEDFDLQYCCRNPGAQFIARLRHWSQPAQSRACA